LLRLNGNASQKAKKEEKEHVFHTKMNFSVSGNLKTGSKVGNLPICKQHTLKTDGSGQVLIIAGAL
jgi:hypothetical protein